MYDTCLAGVTTLLAALYTENRYLIAHIASHNLCSANLQKGKNANVPKWENLLQWIAQMFVWLLHSQMAHKKLMTRRSSYKNMNQGMKMNYGTILLCYYIWIGHTWTVTRFCSQPLSVIWTPCQQFPTAEKHINCKCWNARCYKYQYDAWIMLLITVSNIFTKKVFMYQLDKFICYARQSWTWNIYQNIDASCMYLKTCAYNRINFLQRNQMNCLWLNLINIEYRFICSTSTCIFWAFLQASCFLAQQEIVASTGDSTALFDAVDEFTVCLRCGWWTHSMSGSEEVSPNKRNQTCKL